MNEWLTLKEAAELINAAPSTLRHWIKRKILHPDKRGRDNFVRGEDVVRLAKQNKFVPRVKGKTCK